jgi:hypothetical protein
MLIFTMPSLQTNGRCREMLRPVATRSIPASTGSSSSSCQANQLVHLLTNSSFSKANDIAQKFCKQFTFTIVHKSNPRARKVKRSLRAKHKFDTTYKPFTPADTFEAINASKLSSAVGPDGLTAVHLKQIGPWGCAYLTDLFNLSISNANLQAIWKAAIIVQVLEPGIPATDGSSYHPISLLSPCVKILELRLLMDVTAALPKHASQYGFAPDHSCTTTLLQIVTCVVIGFNQPKPARCSTLYMLDISKAFDALDHTLLIEKISESCLNPSIVRWLSAYISGHKAWCIYGSATSKQGTLCSGVLQWSVLSPALFNHHVSDFPCPISDGILESYADDFSLLESDSDLTVLEQKL